VGIFVLSRSPVLLSSAWIRRAQAAQAAGTPAQTAAMLAAALGANPGHAVADRMKGDVQLSLGRLGESLDHYCLAQVL
jgi:hypothetical protein